MPLRLVHMILEQKYSILVSPVWKQKQKQTNKQTFTSELLMTANASTELVMSCFHHVQNGRIVGTLPSGKRYLYQYVPAFTLMTNKPGTLLLFTSFETENARS